MNSPSPRFLDAASVTSALPWHTLIDALAEAFIADEVHVPSRHHHELHAGGENPPVLLLMPAWSARHGVGTKLVTVFPGNARLGEPTIQGLYVLSDGASGRPLAVLDGGALTVRRTAAASALASRCLSRPDSRTLLMVGAGRLARSLPPAHAAVRPIDRVLVWGPKEEEVHAAVCDLLAQGIAAEPAGALEAAVHEADIVSCATLSALPLVRGDWLRAGTHLDLVGAFKATMRETDARVFERADAVWCDTLAGALVEGGDLVQAIDEGRFRADRVCGDMVALCRQEHLLRREPTDITVFKSVGLALEDLVAARLCLDTCLSEND